MSHGLVRVQSPLVQRTTSVKPSQKHTITRRRLPGEGNGDPREIEWMLAPNWWWTLVQLRPSVRWEAKSVEGRAIEQFYEHCRWPASASWWGLRARRWLGKFWSIPVSLRLVSVRWGNRSAWRSRPNGACAGGFRWFRVGWADEEAGVWLELQVAQMSLVVAEQGGGSALALGCGWFGRAGGWRRRWRRVVSALWACVVGLLQPFAVLLKVREWPVEWQNLATAWFYSSCLLHVCVQILFPNASLLLFCLFSNAEHPFLLVDWHFSGVLYLPPPFDLFWWIIGKGDDRTGLLREWLGIEEWFTESRLCCGVSRLGSDYWGRSVVEQLSRLWHTKGEREIVYIYITSPKLCQVAP